MNPARLLSLLLALFPVSTGAAALETVDDTGRTVRLAGTAERIVTLSPHATELVVAAGASARLVGIIDAGATPDGLAGLPRVGAAGAIDREAVLRLRPDLVIAWQSGNRAADIAWIEAMGIAVYRSEPRRLARIAAAIDAIGRLSGTPDPARRAAARFEQQVARGCRDMPQRPVYVEVWDRPTLSVGGRHWLNDVLAAAGLYNVFADVDRGVFPVQTEAVAANAAVLRISLRRGFDGSRADRLADLLARPGPQLGEAIGLLCEQRRITRASDHRTLPTPPRP